MFTLLSISLWSVFLSGCYAKLYTSVSTLPSLSYDFVVVGGGTAGSVVASRLTENPDFSVLVLEAGVSNAGVLDSEAPFLVVDMASNPLWSWNFSTTPQFGLGGRTGPYPRAHILGGCSSHNGMYYTRGSAEDFNRYAAVTGDEGWSWDNLLPYFFKNENWTAPADGHDTRGQFDPGVHSTHGMMSVSLTGFSYPASARVLQTTKELPEEFPFNLDMNSGTPLGVGWLQETIGDGERSSAATAYLPPDIQQRPNLDIFLNARVTRLLANTSSDGVSFHSVEFSQDQNAPRLTVTARKEIILSAGAVGTPSILQHSGVGNKTTLTALGLPVLLDLPRVGQNAADHPLVDPTWAVSGNETLEAVQQNATRRTEAETEWNATRTGPFTAIGVTHVGWARVAGVYAPGEDPAAGPASPHVELMFTVGTSAGSFGGLMPGRFFSIGTAVVAPTSRGSVTINSTDPFEPPLIDPGLLANDTDLHALREAVKMAQRFVTAPVWAGYILSPANAIAGTTDDDAALEAAIIAAAGSSSHLVGTAGMSARGSTDGVVDPDLLVKGARGLRVIDASVLPFIPAAHTQVATYVIAERAADLVKAAWA
ncbi:aryl-alcohol oxidase [Mycena galericulata]|nr:aryl-alcohol oxidase [Mycena galericulata]